jgi:hypothetical protein
MEPLTENKRYLIKNGTSYYIGIYSDIGIFEHVVFKYVTKYTKSGINHPIKKLKLGLACDPSATFYDLEEIRMNCKKARENMEKRALNILLSRVVNELFVWY